MTTTPEKLLEFVKEKKVKWVDLQFMDIPGYIQHITIPSYTLKVEDFTDGIGKLDGSSIKGFKSIFESDMRMFPDPSTCAILPWTDNTPHRTMRLICDLYDAFGGPRFTRDPRHIAQRAEEAVKKAGFDVSYWGPELEFFVFDSVRLLPGYFSARDAWSGTGYEIESKEAPWSQTSGINHPIRFKEG